MMDMKKMGQQMMEFYKTTFDNSFNTLMMCQEQLERLGAMYWGQMGSLPEEAKKNLETIILRLKETGARILLAGMLALPVLELT